MVIFLVDFLLLLNCLSVTSTSALVPETFRPPCCSYTPNTLVSTTRFLREESGVPAEIETAVDAVLNRIAEAHLEPETKSRKVSHDATFEHEHFLHSRRETTAKALFDHKAIQRWIKNENEAKAEHPESEISVVSKLVDYFGDEELYKILEHAVTDSKYESVAKNLQAEQMHYWIKENKAPDKVFDLFGLGNPWFNILRDPKFLDYVTYFDEFHAINPEPPTSMVTKILKHHKAGDLILQIDQVETDGSEEVQYVAKRLEDELIAHLTQTKTLGGALKALEINSFALFVLRRDTLKSICLKLLVGYIREQPDTKVDVISELVERFGENLVVSSITTANPDDAMGVELMPVLHAYWVRKDKSPAQVMTVLKQVKEKEESNSLRTQISDAWFSYVDYIVEKKLPGIQYLLKLLENSLPPEALSIFFLKLERYPNMRRAIEQPPETMFEVLGLAENHEAMIKRPMFLIWLAYKQRYDGSNPAHKKSLATILADHFGREKAEQLVNELQEVLKDEQTPLARAKVLSLDDLSLGSSGQAEN